MDLDHLYKNLPDFVSFHKVIRRYVQNLASVTAIVKWLQEGAVVQPIVAKDPVEALSDY